MSKIMQTEKLEQGSEAWLQERAGKATASRFKDILATIRNGEAVARARYRSELVIERLTGAPVERYRNAAMDWGNSTEELARVEYTLKTGNLVDESGFYKHPTLEAGASPDGLVGEDGLVEIKSRETYNHIKMLRADEVAPEYFPQLMGQMWIIGKQWVDFVSFAPEFPENAQLFIQRVPRDEAYIANLASEVAKFLHEVEQEIVFVREYRR